MQAKFIVPPKKELNGTWGESLLWNGHKIPLRPGIIELNQNLRTITTDREGGFADKPRKARNNVMELFRNRFLDAFDMQDKRFIGLLADRAPETITVYGNHLGHIINVEKESEIFKKLKEKESSIGDAISHQNKRYNVFKGDINKIARLYPNAIDIAEFDHCMQAKVLLIEELCDTWAICAANEAVLLVAWGTPRRPDLDYEVPAGDKAHAEIYMPQLLEGLEDRGFKIIRHDWVWYLDNYPMRVQMIATKRI